MTDTWRNDEGLCISYMHTVVAEFWKNDEKLINIIRDVSVKLKDAPSIYNMCTNVDTIIYYKRWTRAIIIVFAIKPESFLSEIRSEFGQILQILSMRYLMSTQQIHLFAVAYIIHIFTIYFVRQLVFIKIIDWMYYNVGESQTVVEVISNGYLYTLRSMYTVSF